MIKRTYDYKRKEEIVDNVFHFEYEFDLNKKIESLELADMIAYSQQGDVRLQDLFLKYDMKDDISAESLLEMMNEYRLILKKENE